MTQNSVEKHATAFIIEDDLKLATIFNKALEMANFETEIIQDGRTALERLQTVHPKLIVLDIQLPYISGEDILYLIRNDKHLMDIRVVVVTADLFKAQSVRHAADQVVLKPVGFERLYNLIISLEV